MFLPVVGGAIVYSPLGGASAALLVLFDVGDEVFKVGGCIHLRLLRFILLIPLRHILLFKNIYIINMFDLEMKLVLFGE